MTKRAFGTLHATALLLLLCAATAPAQEAARRATAGA